MQEVEPGTMFGAWRVKEKTGHGQKYTCECTSCGAIHNIRVYDLVKNKSLCCRKCANTIASDNKSNSEKSPVYSSYTHMLQRCLNPKSKDYPHYGGRGITVDPLWIDSYEAFVLQMGEQPPGHTIERKDPDKGYNAENCVWLARKDQPKNRTNTIHIEMLGEKKIASEWSQDPRCVVPQSTFYRRLKLGIDPLEAMTTPSKGSKKNA